MPRQFNEKSIVLSTNDAGIIWYSHAKIMNLDLAHTIQKKKKTSLKCITDLNVRAKTIKMLEENMGENLWELK